MGDKMNLLKPYGGGFNCGFRVSSFEKSADNDIICLFTFIIQDKETSKKLFPNPDYVKAKKDYFDKAVKVTTTLSEYEK